MPKVNITELVELTSSTSGTINIDLNKVVDDVYVHASSGFVFNNNITINFIGNVVPNSSTITVLLNLASVVPGTGTLQINGINIDSKYYNNKVVIDFTNMLGTWFTRIYSSLEGSNIIGSTQLINNSVTNHKIADGSVSLNKLAANSVDNSKITNSSISYEKLDNSSKIKSLVYNVSLENLEQSFNSIFIESVAGVSILDINISVVKALSGTDNAVIDFRLNNLSLFSAVPTLLASTPINTELIIVPNQNNSFVKGLNKIEARASKVTPGGKLLISINYA